MESETLLIIGNGFDLQCGLKSSYEDFFSWLRQDITRAEDNIWAVHFLNTPPEGKLWFNVEKSLQKVLSSNEHLKWVKNADHYYREGMFLHNSVEARYIISKKPRVLYKSLDLDNYWFLDELRSFEQQFSGYLQSEVSNNTNYLYNVAKLMEKLTDGETVSVINFNYTNPFKFYFSNSGYNKISDMVSMVSNVHGTYEDDNIIFGIDATSKHHENARIFTKTYRKMFQNTPAKTLDSGIKTIKFYGHSLGESDYSYFQSIFDFCYIYDYMEANGNAVNLQFYFTVYNENERTDIIRNATDSVYKLITAYGNTLDNKDKGKNLLHKLLLEGRINIIFLADLDSGIM